MVETVEQLQKYFDEHEIEGSVYFTEPSYVSAIVGMTQDERLVYDYDKIRAIPFMGEKAPVVLYRDLLEMI